MKSSKINLLDCTLRDGGYYNNWKFDKKLINKYLNVISEYVEHVEIGFRFFNKDSSLGETAYSKFSFLKKITKPKNLKLGVMINASDLIFYSKNNTITAVKKIFPVKEPKISFVRIACQSFEVEKILPAISLLSKDYDVMVNIMQISELNETILKKMCNLLQSKIKCLYIADSLGSLAPNEVINKSKILKKYWNGELGIHAHDNMKNALNNTLTAVKSGFSWADGTILGMGRGAGNAKIENLIRKLKKEKPNKIYNLIEGDFVKLKKKYKWGFNKYYNLAGKYKIHPTYIQTILNDKRYKKFDYIKIINNLKKINASKYNPNELMYSLFDKVSKKKIQTLKNINNINQKKALIIGSNSINLKNKKFLENKIKNENYFVLALNTTKHLSESFINYRVSSHPLRLISEIENFKRTKSKIILPTGILPSNTLKHANMKSIYFYDMIIKPNLLKINKDYCILPNAMSITFAIAVLIRWRFKYIELAGFDLRSNSTDNTKGILKRINKIKKKIILKNPKRLNII